MDIKDVKRNINKNVMYTNVKLGIKKPYMLKACVIRKNEKDYYYQAEIEENEATCLMIVPLSEIEEIK